jgi:hypothetical protein
LTIIIQNEGAFLKGIADVDGRKLLAYDTQFICECIITRFTTHQQPISIRSSHQIYHSLEQNTDKIFKRLRILPRVQR